METIKHLWYNKELEKYFFTNLNEICKSCGKLIKKNIIIAQYYTRKDYYFTFYCMHCTDKVKDNSLINSYRYAIVKDRPPIGSFIVHDDGSFHLKDTRNQDTVFSAVNIESETTVDKTKACKDPTFMIDPNYKNFDIKSLEEKDKPLSLEEADHHLNKLFNSKPILDDKTENRKKLENKS